MLAIKIGNSNIGIGLFEGAVLRRTWRAETRAEKTADEYASLITDFLGELNHGGPAIESIAIGSVVPALSATFQEMSRRYFDCEPFVVAPGIESGIGIHYDDPRALGADRLVDLVAVKARYGAPAIVIDFGTATTFNVLDAGGNFVGGAIAPGLAMQAEALHQFTAKLPRVEISAPPRAVATNTRDALRSGILLGHAGLVEGLTTRLREETNMPQMRVIATGGFAQLMAPYCPSIEIVDTQLAFEGLRLLFEMNARQTLA